MKPNLLTRREFIRRSIVIASVAGTIPSFLSRTVWALDNPLTSADALVTGDDPIMVVVQLSGGNDGLNTIIPYTNDIYYKSRPKLAIPAKDILPINGQLGFHPQLSKFKALFDEGKMAIVEGVGYPNPNRSHFRSMEIWHTASDADKVEKYGWLGRYFDNKCQGCDPTTAVNIGKILPQAFSAKTPFGISFEDPEMYRWVDTGAATGEAMKSAESYFKKLNKVDQPSMGGMDAPHGSIDYLQRTAMNAQLSSDKIREVTKQYHSNINYPDTEIGHGLKLVAQMIAGKLPTRIFYVSQSGYDTHSNQLRDQNKLLNELAEAMHAFYADLEQQRNADRVLAFSFSEFGRRVAENASGGTDHGAAGPMFVFGKRVKPGLYGAAPDLQDLQAGDLKYKIDFRSVYATVLENWMKTPSTPILGRAFPKLEFV